MMAFFTRCFVNRNRLACWLVSGIWALCALPGTVLAADEVSLRFAEIRAVNEGYELEAQFVLKPNSTLEDALEKGVALHFVAELEITRPRSWCKAMPPSLHHGGMVSPTTEFWPTCRAPRRAWCGAIPTSNGCAAPRISPVLRASRPPCSTRFGQCSPGVVNCYM